MSNNELNPGRQPLVVDGIRTPFLRSQTGYKDLMAYELLAMAISSLVKRSGIDTRLVERVVMGTVLQEPRTTNVAREAALAAGIPKEVPAATVTAACISANVAITSVSEAIMAGNLELAIAGGVETLSDVPIRYQKAVRERLIASQKARRPADYIDLLKGLKPTDLLPEVPAIAEFSTGQTMGQSAERLAKRLGITREEQDAFALGSHLKAAKAQADGHLAAEIAPVFIPPSCELVSADNGIRGDSTLEKLSKLPPAFDKNFGSVSAGNSSFLTDGAAACLVASAKKAEELGLTPLAKIVATSFVALDPLEELLLGPALAIPKLLDKAGLTVADIGVWELHEAFAVPVLAVNKLFQDEDFCKNRLGKAELLGPIPESKLNQWGGSLSLGHPFGATGARLVTTCARRLHHENQRYGIVSACAAGALGHATLLERVA